MAETQDRDDHERLDDEVFRGERKHGRIVSLYDGFARLRGEVIEAEAELHARDPNRHELLAAELLQVAAVAMRLRKHALLHDDDSPVQ